MTDQPAPEPDPDEIRAAVRERWERAAGNWRSGTARLQSVAMDVSRWLVEAIRPQPGMRVLELAAGIGETGFLAAELIQPGGTLISSDGAEAMVQQAQERAHELGLTNVEFKPLELEWIDLPTADVDAILCRWGLMFALDREAAVREMRRVLRPGGRVALATWAAAERNPWATTPRQVLYDAGLVPSLFQPGPGQFDLADPAAVTALLEDAGFAEVETAEVPLVYTYADVADWIATTACFSAPFGDLLAQLDERQLADVHERFAAAAQPYLQGDGSIAVPGVSLAAAADA